MPTRRYPRVEVDHRTYDLLRIEEVLSDKSIKEILAVLVERGVSRKAIEVLDHKTTASETIATKRPQDRPTIEMECHLVGDIEKCAKQEKKRFLADDQVAIAKIKEMWNAGQRNQAEIARAIGYHKATTYDNIRKMIKAGELAN
jgi:uncharacterized membrane protein